MKQQAAKPWAEEPGYQRLWHFLLAMRLFQMQKQLDRCYAEADQSGFEQFRKDFIWWMNPNDPEGRYWIQFIHEYQFKAQKQLSLF